MAKDDSTRAMTCLSAMREGRRWFDEQLCEHMERNYPPSGVVRNDGVDVGAASAIATVRSDSAYHLAEFLYVARELGLWRRDRLTQLIARHNADMAALMSDKRSLQIRGLTLTRVEHAVFSEDQHRKIFDDQAEEPDALMRLDQSDLCRLLSPLMSPEGCRQILVEMAKGGLLKTRGRGRVFVSSPGILEDLFREHLMIIDRTMRGEA